MLIKINNNVYCPHLVLWVNQQVKWKRCRYSWSERSSGGGGSSSARSGREPLVGALSPHNQHRYYTYILCARLLSRTIVSPSSFVTRVMPNWTVNPTGSRRRKNWFHCFFSFVANWIACTWNLHKETKQSEICKFK